MNANRKAQNVMGTAPKHEQASNGNRYERSALTIELRAQSSQVIDIARTVSGLEIDRSRNATETTRCAPFVPASFIGVNTGIPAVSGLGAMGVMP